MIYHTRGEHAIYYTTDAFFLIMNFNMNISWLTIVININFKTLKAKMMKWKKKSISSEAISLIHYRTVLLVEQYPWFTTERSINIYMELQDQFSFRKHDILKDIKNNTNVDIKFSVHNMFLE